MRAVTSEMSTRLLISISGHFTSSASVLAVKPLLMKSFCGVDSCWMQLCAQWWLVITSPEAEMKLPEQPCASRTDERRTWSSHFPSGLKWYFASTFSDGKLLNVHIPSSAREPGANAMHAAATAAHPRRPVFIG